MRTPGIRAAIFKPVTSGVFVPEPASRWLWGEGSGTTATDAKGNLNLSLENPQWTPDYRIDGNDSSPVEFFSGASNKYWDLESFSVIQWVEPQAIAGSGGDIFGLTKGDSAGIANHSFTIYMNFTKFGFYVSSGSSYQTFNLSKTISNGNIYFIAVVYTRNGGSSNNKCKSYIRNYTAGEPDFLTGLSTSVILMQQNSGFKIVSRANRTDYNGLDGVLKQSEIYTAALGDNQIQEIYNRGLL